MEGKYKITSANGINKFPRSNLREHIHFPLKVTKTKGNFLSLSPPSPFVSRFHLPKISERKIKRIKRREENKILQYRISLSLRRISPFLLILTEKNTPINLFIALSTLATPWLPKKNSTIIPSKRYISTSSE